MIHNKIYAQKLTTTQDQTKINEKNWKGNKFVHKFWKELRDCKGT